MQAMTPRERVAAALNHSEPDRVPLDIGGGQSTSLVVEAYDNLRKHTGRPGGEPKYLSYAFRVARLDEDTVALATGLWRPRSITSRLTCRRRMLWP